MESLRFCTTGFLLYFLKFILAIQTQYPILETSLTTEISNLFTVFESRF